MNKIQRLISAIRRFAEDRFTGIIHVEISWNQGGIREATIREVGKKEVV